MGIDDQPWYWNAVDKTVVAQALSKQEDGSFIIKDATAPGNYTLSVRANGVTRLARIIKYGEKYGFVQDDLYESVEALVIYHRDVSLKCYNPELDTCLTTPIPKVPKRNRSTGSWEKNHACKPSVSNPSCDESWELSLILENVRTIQTAINRHARIHGHIKKEFDKADNLNHQLAKHLAELERKTYELNSICENQKSALAAGCLDERATEAMKNNHMILGRSLEKLTNEKNNLSERRNHLCKLMDEMKTQMMQCLKSKKLEELNFTKLCEVLPEGENIPERIKKTADHCIDMSSKETLNMSRELASMELKWGPERWLVNESDKAYSEKLIQAAKERAVKAGLGTDGIFLIRPSASRPNFLVLDVLCGDKIMHILIEQVEKGWGFCKTGSYLVTVGDLVRYYSHESLEAHNPEVKTCLTFPALPANA